MERQATDAIGPGSQRLASSVTRGGLHSCLGRVQLSSLPHSRFSQAWSSGTRQEQEEAWLSCWRRKHTGASGYENYPWRGWGGGGRRIQEGLLTQSSGRAPLPPHMCSLTAQPSADPRWHRGVLPHAPVQAFISAMPSSVLNSHSV